MDPRVLALAALALLLPAPAAGQVAQANGRYWLPADYNYAFYERHNEAARSFYPAHFAHFRIYEEGLQGQAGLEDRMEAARLRVLDLVTDPPAYEPPFSLVAPEWAKIAHPTGNAMDWTHHLHEQLYDILSSDRIQDRQALGERAISHYLTNEPAAFSTRGYGHAFMMSGGSWAGEFARRFPEMNGILWAYHWHHAAIYEALMEETREARQAALDNVLTTFTDSVLVDLPEYMPLTAQVAPQVFRDVPRGSPHLRQPPHDARRRERHHGGRVDSSGRKGSRDRPAVGANALPEPGLGRPPHRCGRGARGHAHGCHAHPDPAPGRPVAAPGAPRG